MKILNITVTNKIATYFQRDGVIVCGNNDYKVKFTFDSEWNGHEKKTARFIWNGMYYDQTFTGNECPVPIISGATKVSVGVYAGDLSTTTPAVIPCKKSILCTEAMATEGLAKDYVDEALHIIEDAGIEAVETVREAADSFAAEMGVVQSTGNSETAVMSQKAATEAFMTPAEAESKFANAIKATATGEVIRINDASPLKRTNTKVSGVANPTSVTVTRCGKNLVRTYCDGAVNNYNGITAVTNEDGSIALNGTATGDIWFSIVNQGKNSFSLPSGDYVFSLGASLPAGCYSSIFEYDHGTQVVELLKINESNSYGALFIDHSIHSFDWFVYFPSGMTLNNFTVYPQIELGNEASAFEKPNYQNFTPKADGTIDSLVTTSYSTTIYSDTEGAVLEVEYNVDTDKAIDDLNEKIDKVADTVNKNNNEVNKQLQEVDKSLSSFANAIKATASGEIVRVDGTSPLQQSLSVKVRGVADPTKVTVTRCGKNLVRTYRHDSSYNYLGVTAVINEDGGITLNGTTTGFLFYEFIVHNRNGFSLPSGDYVFSLGTTLPNGCRSVAKEYIGGVEGLEFMVTRSPMSYGIASIDHRAEGFTWYVEIPSGTTLNNFTVYPQIELGTEPTEFVKPNYQTFTPNADGTIDGIICISPTTTIITDTEGAILEVEYNVDTGKAIADIASKIPNGAIFPFAEYSLPIVYFEGSTSGMTKDNAVNLNYTYGERSGTCTLKWQGSSSIAYPKKNYTVKFDNEFEAAEGWGAHKKYCLKADWIDASHLRNVISAKLWGEIVRSRPTSDLVTRLSALPNCGAIDGFPCFVVINGEWQGIYNFNIPKEDFMLGMGDGTREVILCGDNACAGNQFKAEATLDTLAGEGDTVAFEVEYAADEFADEDIQASLNRLITACINSDGTDIDTTIAQYLDIKSAIDYYVFTVLVKGGDIMNKNQIFATYDGEKWFMSAYDLDTTFGQNWDGSAFLSSAHEGNISDYGNVSFATFANFHRLMELLYNYKRTEVIARYKELREGVMSLSSVATKLYNYAGIIPMGAHIAEQELWKEMPLASVKNVAQIVAWYQDRLNQVDKEIATLEETL